MTRPHPRSTLFPYTTLFRSNRARRSITSPQRFFSVGRSTQLSVDHVDHASSFVGECPCHLSSQIHSAPAMCTSVPKIDRKSTRLNSSHVEISYAVFCLKKKN